MGAFSGVEIYILVVNFNFKTKYQAFNLVQIKFNDGRSKNHKIFSYMGRALRGVGGRCIEKKGLEPKY